MAESQAWNNTVSSLLNNIYRCADKKTWYSGVVDAYDRTRPRYPQQLLSQVQQITKLETGQKVLEIGSGVGIASRELAQWGIELIGIEPSLSACEIARQKCLDYENAEFINSTFEDWDSEGQKFSAVIASTSFHWVTPEIRTQKSAWLLKDHGYLILLWNTPPQPNEAVIQKLIPIYQTYAPKLALQESVAHHQVNLEVFGREIIDSGYFQDLITEQVISQVSYTVEEYLTLLTTLSPYIQLEKAQCNVLLSKLERCLNLNYGDSLDLTYLSMLQIVRKI